MALHQPDGGRTDPGQRLAKRPSLDGGSKPPRSKVSPGWENGGVTHFFCPLPHRSYSKALFRGIGIGHGHGWGMCKAKKGHYKKIVCVNECSSTGGSAREVRTGGSDQRGGTGSMLPPPWEVGGGGGCSPSSSSFRKALAPASDSARLTTST